MRIATSKFTYIFGESGVVNECLVEREVEALIDGAQRIVVHHGYYSDLRAGVVTVEPYTNCRIVRSSFSPTFRSISEIELPVPLLKGSRHRFACKVLVHTTERCTPIFDTCPDNDMDEHWLGVQFHPDCLPEEAWTYRAATEAEIPWEPTGGQQLSLSPFGYAEAHFEDLRRGLHYGLAWKWND